MRNQEDLKHSRLFINCSQFPALRPVIVPGSPRCQEPKSTYSCAKSEHGEGSNKIGRAYTHMLNGLIVYQHPSKAAVHEKGEGVKRCARS